MQIGKRAVALVACLALLAGCFGYNSSAKKWAYVGDSLFVVGGGAAVGWDLATRPGPCSGPNCPIYTSKIDGGLVAGVLLLSAGVFGFLFNATRSNVKTSR